MSTSSHYSLGLCRTPRCLRGTQIRARSIDDPKLWLGAGSAGQLDWDEVPRRPAGKVQFSPELTVQLPGIAAGHAARVTELRIHKTGPTRSCSPVRYGSPSSPKRWNGSRECPSNLARGSRPRAPRE